MTTSMPPTSPLERLEADVLLRIAAHRGALQAKGSLRLEIALTFTALIAGVAIGLLAPRPVSAARGSEAVVLADDVRLAPSSLLASNP